MSKIAFLWRKGLWALINMLFLLLILLSVLYLYLESQLPAVDLLKNAKLQVPLRIYTKDGKLIQEYGERKSIPLTYSEIPKLLIYAVLATEDQRFFEHPGVDIMGLGRATVRMIQTGTKSQGGSTITMQVARNFFLSRKKTFLRKFNEILLAIKIDKELSKEKILELYLNVIYLGNRAYGVGAAAEVYYGKPLKELTLAELAMIVGLPQAPSTQNPIANPKAAKKRRDHVLERMLEAKYINQEQYEEAIKQPVTHAKYHRSQIDIHAPYVAEMIRQSLYEHYGEKTYTNGYKVYTTIDSQLQETANEVLANHLIAYDRRHGYRGPASHIEQIARQSQSSIRKQLSHYPAIQHFLPAAVMHVGQRSAQALLTNGQMITLPWQGIVWARPALRNGWMGRSPQQAGQVLKAGDIIYVTYHNKEWHLGQIPEAEAALVALNPHNGAIEALVGGFNFVKSTFNRVTQSSRQPGSSFKPFIYAAGLTKGYTLATLINDAPIVVDNPGQPTWRPHNDNNTFSGPIRMKEALVRSRNMVSIRILQDLGFDYAINFATRFGFSKSSLPRGLSLALGTLSVSPMDLASAYAVFANGGYKIEPFLIDHITDNDGKVLLKAKPNVVCSDCNINDRKPEQGLAQPVISKDIAFLMYTALRDVIQHGTAQAARVLNRDDIAGKTGTTNDKFDAWFSGFHSNLVVTTWVGYDQPQSLHEYGAQVALPMWIDFMKVALKNLPKVYPTQPEHVISARIDPQSGALANNEQPNAITEYFIEDTIPPIDSTPGTSRYVQSAVPIPEESLF